MKVLNYYQKWFKKIQPNEYITINSQKKYLCKKGYKKGEKFSKDNICIKGPVAGLMPKYYEIIVGRKAVKNIKTDHPVTWDNILR